MNRRDILKIATVATAGVMVGGLNAAESAPKNRAKMKIQNPDKPTDFELKHMPEITIKDKDKSGFTTVEVTVGQNNIIHPSSKDHWIDYIELYADGELVGRVELNGAISRGFASFGVDLSKVKTLKAVEGCNLHGIWEHSISV